jgi:hypothetical protein
MIADELIEKGVAKEDIILGFIDSDVKTHPDLAIA